MLLSQLTSCQITEWRAYDRLEPIGERRGDYRVALLCSVITNLIMSIYGVEDGKRATLQDFLLQWGEEIKEEETIVQSVDDMKKTFLSIVGDVVPKGEKGK